MTTEFHNRKAITNSSYPDKRVISAPNGMWVPQRRVTHTGGCNRGYYRAKVEGFEAGVVTRVEGLTTNLPTSKRKRRRMLQAYRHIDPWQDVTKPTFDRTQAIMIAFGPKVASEVLSRQIV